VKCFAWRSRGSLQEWLKSLLGSLDWSEAWRRESLSSREVGSKYFHVSGVAKRAEGAWASFYSPQQESSWLGSRDSDMSELGARHVHKWLLEPGLGTRHIQCYDLTRVITHRPEMSGPWPNMSRKGYCNPVTWLDKSGKGLSHCEESVERICSVQELDMSGFAYWNLTTISDKSDGLRNPVRRPDMFDFSKKLDWKVFSMIGTSPTHPMHPPW
jgi:hypothetical protein